MARKTNEIQDEMLTAIAASQELSTQLTSTSKFAVFRLFTFIVATAISLLEKMFDDHKKELDDKLANQKSGTLAWYRTMALRFQFGFDLVPDRDYFDNENATEDQIRASKIVKYAAVVESRDFSRVILKIAGETNGVLSEFPENDAKIEAFEQYISDIRFAGVQVTVINSKADILKLSITIQRDALVLDAHGMSNLNANYPVNDAIQEFMKELPFNGEFKLSALVDKLQKAEGVLDATIEDAKSAWINSVTGNYDSFQPIHISKTPFSGYFKVDDSSTITYVV